MKESRPDRTALMAMLDILIKGPTVVDGSGRKAFRADVGISGGEITRVGVTRDVDAGLVVEASGKVVCPGFIDIHSHNDLYVIRDDYRELFEPYLRQGITTCVMNNCGWSPAPWPERESELMRSTLRSMGISRDLRPEWSSQKDFHQYVKSRGLPMNMVPLAAHNPVRIAVMGDEARFSTPEELELMKAMVREGMEAGCRGFSTGLTYFPGMYAHTDEIVELVKVAGEYGGRYATHVRGHCETYDRAVREAIEIASRAGCGLQLSHVFAVPYLGWKAAPLYHALKVIEAVNRLVPLPGVPNPVLKSAIKRVDSALEEGMDVGMDFIPYVLGNTTVTQLYPPWANRGGTDALIERLKDLRARKRIERDVETVRPEWPHWEEGSWSDNYVRSIGWLMLKILSVASEKNRYMEGRRVVDLAEEAGKGPFDFLADLTVEEEGMVTYLFGVPPRPWAEKVFTVVHRHPALSVGADVIFPEAGKPPQSAYGCFVRIIEHYVKELGLYSLEDAVRRCTGLAASRYGLDDRGVIAEGKAADLVVFDLEEIHDNSDFDDPRHYPDGMELVVVNGTVVVQDGDYRKEVLAGALLER